MPVTKRASQCEPGGLFDDLSIEHQQFRIGGLRARQCQGAGHRRRRVETGRECQRSLDGKPEQRVQLDRRGASGRQRGGRLVLGLRQSELTL